MGCLLKNLYPCFFRNNFVATFLDPRFKDKHVDTPEAFRRKIYDWISIMEDNIEIGEQNEVKFIIF